MSSRWDSRESRVNADQELQLNLRYDSADDEPLQLTDSCEVTAEPRGVVVPQGK